MIRVRNKDVGRNALIVQTRPNIPCIIIEPQSADGYVTVRYSDDHGYCYVRIDRAKLRWANDKRAKCPTCGQHLKGE
jgi:hypothetical protein